MGIQVTAIASKFPGQPQPNHLWSPDVVDSWRAPDMEGFEPQTVGQLAMRNSLAILASDPFAGALSRHILPAGQPTSTLEVAAAERALARSGTAPEDIGLLIQQSSADDVVLPTNATLIHEALGLPEDCFCTSIEAGNNSFLTALSMAERMLTVSPGRCGLIVNSSQRTQLVDPTARWAPWFGDGATAVVVAPSETGGILAQTHRVDPGMKRAYCVDSPGHDRWTGSDKIELRVDQPEVLQVHFLCVVDRFVDACKDTLQAASVSIEDVALVAVHQPAGWLLPAVSEALNLRPDQVVTTFPDYASVAACNIPLVLERAIGDSRLEDGALVLMVAGGAGITWSSILLRWSA